MPFKPNLLSLAPVSRPRVSDQVYATLHAQIVDLSLPPGTRMSELDVARAVGVSRQPVRDAFFRLAQQGFVDIQPQRATSVSPISIERVLQARFVRTAMEVETIKAASRSVSDADLQRLRATLDQQGEAVRNDEKSRFHALDDRFHQEICVISGNPFAWQIISENKAHLDRARLLSLSFNLEKTLEEHLRIVKALEDRDSEECERRMRHHLSRLVDEIGRIQTENPSYFSI
ncbi:GntR family transcriptional regulator [Aliiruegeria sabulilitoris]|uniref:GntR family transcriptional regulator n=1 Tax=Aliiruegeria sabulilitoris TaxID=1510458 RepID=UPI00082B6A21|nr:GntR family transcriptional regulator [Aliiruegeria sabulilitoris]NDR58479.1 GntR family transcriptional regulator [Pseudoruegeria sp. M32A2M]